MLVPFLEKRRGQKKGEIQVFILKLVYNEVED